MVGFLHTNQGKFDVLKELALFLQEFSYQGIWYVFPNPTNQPTKASLMGQIN